jgi:PKD repeat protein
MSITNPRLLISGVVMLLLSLPVLAQYTGGDNSGAVQVGITQASCSAVTYPAIFTGGSEDGYSQIGLTQSACSTPVMPAIFAGGSDNAYSAASLAQSNCTPLVMPAIFSGGSDDGYSYMAVTQSICSPLVLPGIYAGGDGNILSSSSVNAACTQLANFIGDTLNVCAGGTVHFTDLSIGGPISWSWSFPGGTPSSSSSQNPAVVYNTPGTYDVTLTITTAAGNNSLTQTTYITVGTPPAVSISAIPSQCVNASAVTLTQGSPAGGSYSGNGVTGNTFNPATAGVGTHVISYHYTSGCSNTATTSVTVNPVYQFTETQEICSGASLLWQGTSYNTSGTYTKSYVSHNGCDSIYTLHLNVNPVYSYTETHTICNGGSYLWHGSTYNSNGTYTASYVSKKGCDSTYTLHLIVNPPYSFNDYYTMCNGGSYTWHNTTYNSPGTYTVTYYTAAGCDSVYTLHLSAAPAYAFNDYYSICSGDTYTWHGSTYNATGNYTAAYTSKNGCDSIYTLHLTRYNGFAATVNQTICQGSGFNFQGQTYTIAGTYTVQYTSVQGCDSTYTLHLSVNPEYSFTENHSVCSGAAYNWHGNSYSTAGTYYANYTTLSGCDSVYVLNLSVSNDYLFTETQTICAGQSYLWQGSSYNSPGTYTITYTSQQGCDSVRQLNLSVNTVDVQVSLSGATLMANAGGALYQWVDCNDGYSYLDTQTQQTYSPPDNGNFAVIVTQNGCTDTSACTQVMTVGVEQYDLVGVKVYPNPVHDLLVIDYYGNSDAVSYELLDATGRVLMKGNFTEREELDMSPLAKGVYLLRMSNGNLTDLRRVIRQ